MKKLFISSMFIFFTLTMVASASTKTSRVDDDKEKISTPVLQQFGFTFYNAKNVNWSFSQNYQKASFDLDGKKTFAFYDLENNFLVSTQLVDFSDLPQKAKEEILKSYKDYTSIDVLKVIARPIDYQLEDDTNAYWLKITNNESCVIGLIFPNSKLNIVKTEKIK